MADKVIGVYLIGGPPGMDGFKNAFAAEDLGGWPPPEELAALAAPGVPMGVVVALPENVPDEHKDKVTWYRKVGQSQFDAPDDDDRFFRGATYEVKET
jgi:hypothetical protein